LLRLARELALQLDADRSDEPTLLEVQLLRAVELVEGELDENARLGSHDVGASRAIAYGAER
jgi:hypothetical protein